MPYPGTPGGLPDLALIRPGRMHEATGSGRRAFAAVLAGRLSGPVLWVRESRLADNLCPQGLRPFFDPARLVLARPTGGLAVLQVTEEALRSGAVPLVIAELAEAADLTASRRLQLAAGSGGGGVRGLCLLPESRARPNAAETRWLCTPIPQSGSGGATGGRRQLWELVKNKRGCLGVWEVAWGGQAAAPRQNECQNECRNECRNGHALRAAAYA
jgi:protein ImuA